MSSIKPVRRKPNYYKNEFDPSTIGVLLTSHPRQQMFWDDCLPSWTDSPYYVLMGYDDVDTSSIETPMKKYPGVKDIFVTGNRSGHVGGELMQLKMGFKKLFDMGFVYILKLAADMRVGRLEGIRDLWEILEGKYYPIKNGRAMIGAQMLGEETAFMFGCAGLMAAVTSQYDPAKKKGGSAEAYCSRHRRKMNGTVIPIGPLKKFEILDMMHMQGRYAKDNKMTIQKTWDIGEIYGNTS